MKTIKALMAISFVFLFCNIAIANVAQSTNGELVNYKKGDRKNPTPPVTCGVMQVERRGACVDAHVGADGNLHRNK